MIVKNLKLNVNTIMADGLDFTADSARVEKDADGVPVAWELLHINDNSITRHGEDLTLTLTAEDLDAIESYYRAKGSLLPVDSRHALFQFAQSKGVDEADALAMGGGRMAIGFGRLERRGDALWIAGVDYKPFGRELMKAGAFRYFSPAIRGLVDGRLRITSVALDNEPALNRLDAIAAHADDDCLTPGETRINQNQQEKPAMNKLLAALAGLLGVDAIALGADHDADDTVIAKINNLKTSVVSQTALRKQVTDALALAADAADATISGALAGLKAKADAHDSLKIRVDALALDAENGKRDKLIETGLAAGKLTNDMATGWARKQDAAALSAYLEHAPVVVPLGQIAKKETLTEQDSVALSAEDKKYCQMHGYDEAEFLAAKKK